MNTINKQPERHEIEALLPWHAAGTLSRRDADRVEQTLAGGRELARGYDLVREELAETIHLNETLGAPSARAMEKLFAAIDAEDARAPRRQRSFDLGGRHLGVPVEPHSAHPRLGGNRRRGCDPGAGGRDRNGCGQRARCSKRAFARQRAQRRLVCRRALCPADLLTLTRSCRSTAWSRGLEAAGQLGGWALRSNSCYSSFYLSPSDGLMPLRYLPFLGFYKK